VANVRKGGIVFLQVISLIILGLIIVGMLLILKETTISVVDKPKEILFFGYTDEEIKAAYRYHGIMSATFSNAEEPYFYRNGQKVRLFARIK